MEETKRSLAQEQFKNRAILFFALIGFIGIFLSKGTKEPFYQIFQTLFIYIPGFSLFRDPTKFYVLIALSYSILIPYTLEKLGNKIIIFKLKMINIIYFLFILFWAFTIRESLFGELNGTFQRHSVPLEYVSLKNFLVKDTQYAPVLWFPSHSSFSFYSKVHPRIDASSIFSDITVLKIPFLFNNKKKKQLIKEKKIKYVIVPKDIERKIFLTDYKYSEVEYKKTIENLKKVPFLIPINNFGQIVAFEVKSDLL